MISNNFCGTHFCFQGFFALLFLLIGIVCNTQSLQGQDTAVAQVPKQPYSFDHAVGKQIATQTFSLTPEEVEKAQKYSRYQDLNMSRDIAIKIESDIRDIGTWENLPNGDRLWRYKVHLTNAKGVGFRFPATDMPKGAFLFYYNTEKSCLIGPFTNKMPITTNAIVGQDAVIEYYEPAAVKGKLKLHSVLYRFADFPPTFLQNLFLPPPPIINQPISEAYLKEVYELFQKDGNIGGGLMENFKHDLNDIGRWDELPNGDRIWRVQITMKFAVNVELGISKCKIPEGCQLFRYDLNRQNIKQNYTSKFREEWFWIGGKDVILEYYETAKQKGKSILQFSTIDCVPYLGDVFDNSSAKIADNNNSSNSNNSLILPSTTNEQKKATLKPWIDPKNYSNGMLQGFLPNNCNDVYLKDGWPDVGNEPNEECSTAGWDNIWASPDFYPFHAGAGNIPTNQWVADNSADFTSIDFSSADNNYQYDNYIFYRVRNKGNCTSGGGWLNSALYMYYTIGSTGEVWEDSWINNQENGCVLGDQITIYAAGDENNSDPYEFAPIVPLQIDGEFSNFVKWYPPNFCDPNDLTRPYQDLGVCTGQLPAIEDDYKWEICLLARYKALDDPMFDEKEGINSENTTNNIISNNNIVTHNTFFFDPYQQGGGINPIIVSHGHPSAVFVANNNNEVKHLNILLDKISAGSQEALEQLLKVEIIPSEKIWQRWTETGQKGEGVQVVSDRLIRITNLETAKLLDIPFDPNDKEPIAIKITILLPEVGKKALLNNLPNMYKVLLTHEAFDPNEEIRKPTACVFQLNDLQKYGETEIDYQTPLLNIVPNPVQNSAQINYFLPAENNTHVSLHLYDTQGRLIKNLLPTSNSTGGWQTIWVETETLPAGVYIVQLKTQIGSIVQKMIKM